MAVELLCVALGGALVLLQVVLAAFPKALVAPDWAAGPRDTPAPELPQAVQRADRARANLLETFPVFAAAALGIAVLGASSWWTEAAAVVWLVARALYLPAYVFHVPFVRSTIWAVALAALAVLLVALLIAASGSPALPAA